MTTDLVQYTKHSPFELQITKQTSIVLVQRHLSIGYQNERITIKPQGNQICRLQLLFLTRQNTISHFIYSAALPALTSVLARVFGSNSHSQLLSCDTNIMWEGHRRRGRRGLSLFNQRNVSHEQVQSCAYNWTLGPGLSIKQTLLLLSAPPSPLSSQPSHTCMMLLSPESQHVSSES